MTRPTEVARQTLSAWQDEETPATEEPEPTITDEPEQEPETEEPEEEVVVGDEVPTPPPSSPDEEEEPPAEEEEEEEEEPAEETVVSGDPEVAAFLAKYGGDVDKALKGAADLTRLLSRQGQEKNQALQRAAELEQALAEVQAQAQLPTGAVLNQEQRAWVEQAVESENVQGYVQAAVQEGEFALARAVCDAAADAEPYTASRLAHYVDQAEQYAQRLWEQQMMAANQPQEVDRPTLMNVLIEHFPEMPQYESQMVATIERLGPDHPLTQGARSSDPTEAMRSIIDIFEIARVTANQTASTRSTVKRQKRAEADSARAAGVVSSAKATPASAEPPRTRQIAPGLTLEQLDAAWDQ